MLVSDSHEFIFVHIRKTAGSSIRDTLLPISIDQNKNIKSKLTSRILKTETNYQNFAFRQHSPMLEAKKIIPEALFKKYFKFAFVRNPYTRLVSEYEFIKRRPNHGRHKKVSKMNFHQYITYQSKRFDAHQINMLSDKKGILQTDFIGRFENLQEDWNIVCEKLGINNIELSHRKKASKVNYDDYYDKKNIELVEQLWKRDLEVFEYSYQN